MPTKSSVLLSLLLLPLSALAKTIFHNAHIHSLVPDQPVVEAMAVDNEGRILELGRRAQLRKATPDAREVDLGGAHVLPGLIDAHGHLLNLGLALLTADLVGANSKEEIIERLTRFESGLPEGTWLIGRGWDQNRWPDAEFPDAADLDTAFPQRPVWLQRIDGHAGWANRAALAQVERDLDGDWQPEGGRILRDQGKATGVFIDAAMALVNQARPALDDRTRLRALELALAEAARLGLTGVHDAGVDLDTLHLLQQLADAGRLPIRVYAMADGDAAALEWLCRAGLYRHPGDRLQMRAVKLYMDGALGSRGAALLADYSDEAGNRGLLVTPTERIEAAIEKAVRCGVQANTHAIGDRGNRIVLDAYEKLVPTDERDDRRFRIEHAQIVAREDLPRFAELSVIASMQPIHATSDMPWAQARIGRQRLHGAYAWRRLLERDTRLAFGSDFPVEPVSPWYGLYAAITRQDADGEPAGGWLPGQRLNLARALQGFTVDAAYAAFAEDEVGTLEAGKRADFVVLTADPHRQSPLELRATVVQATYVDGQQVYTRPAKAAPEATLPAHAPAAKETSDTSDEVSQPQGAGLTPDERRPNR